MELIGLLLCLVVPWHRRAPLRPTKRQTKAEKKLRSAVEQGDVGKVHAILKGGTVVASKLDSDGRSPLHLAAARGRTECLEILLSYQLNVEARDRD
eukprot:g22070.t1